MEYLYELEKEDLTNNVLEKLKKWLSKQNIEFVETAKKLIIKLNDYFFLYKFNKFIDSLKAGFEFKYSLRILTDDWELYTIDIKKAANRKENHLRRILSRVIGENGKFLKAMEEYGNVKLIVDDRFLYILGDRISVQAASEGFKKLIYGATHSKVLDFVVRFRKHLKYKEKETKYFQKI